MVRREKLLEKVFELALRNGMDHIFQLIKEVP